MLILTSTVVGLIFTFPADAFDPSTPYNSYPNDLQNIRSFEMKHLTKDSIYLDYTGAGVYSDFAFDQYKTELTQRYFPGHPLSSFRETSENTIDKIRDELLDFVGADPKIYSVIFLASATQALKLVGEIFPWTSQSVYAYTRYNHNSVLGIRQYAIDSNSTFKAVSWPPDINEIKSIQTSSNAQNLFAFPLEDNFAGTKPSSKFLYEITHDEEIRKKFIILGDVAAYLPTNPLNLTETPLDACSLSFYKIMGYPNTGALIIRKDFIGKVKKLWYSSLSANFSLPSENIYHLSEKFYLEDENVPLEINLAVHHGLNFLKSIGMKNIQSHVWNLTQKLYKGLNELTHSMGGKVAEIYGNHELNDADVQGGIVAFNLKKTNGGYFGYSAVVEEASEFGFHLRGGCHCNPGACFKSMKISEEKVKKYYDQKTTCGDKNDVVDGIPLGSVRASLGWASTESDVDSFIQWVQDNYVF